ncbi:MAG: CcmD family protein [Planctomycetota bacterium]
MNLTEPLALAAALAAGLLGADPQGVAPAGGDPSQTAAALRGLRFLAGAYTAVWVILAAYLFSLSVRLRRLSQQVRRLKDRLGARP